MQPIVKSTWVKLAWLWSACTLMAIFALLDNWTGLGLFAAVYGYTPLFAIPFILSLKYLWPQQPWPISFVLVVVCYTAQVIYLLAHKLPLLIIADGVLSALALGLIYAHGSDRRGLKVSGYVLLAICGAFVMVPAIVFEPLRSIPVTVSVWLWQCFVGTILVVAASQAPTTREFNIGVLQS